MSRRGLIGLETEYGFAVEGRGAADQVDDATTCVRAFPGACFVGWDYSLESPRADLRGFNLDRLSVDEDDAKFDEGRTVSSWDATVRADRVLSNGARFYNDHGHPEYSTPECVSLAELVLHDLAGERIMRRAAEAFQAQTERSVKVYKNNTDFHGSSYGTHENYLVSREVPVATLAEAAIPILVARQIVCGAGKAGSESGESVPYQISQRADFFVEPINAETLTRRPIFNTRDEPHADPRQWIRLHVIAGDANRIASCTLRKVGLVRLALRLVEVNQYPIWRLQDPVAAFKSISRDEERRFEIPLEGQSHTNAYEIVRSVLSAAEHVLELDEEEQMMVAECHALLDDLPKLGELSRSKIDWCAKKWMLEQVAEEEGLALDAPAMRSYDLAYSDLDPGESLFDALVEMETIESQPTGEEIERCELHAPFTRAEVRALAINKFGAHLETLSWSSLTFRTPAGKKEVVLEPNLRATPELRAATSVESFIQLLEAPHDRES